MLAILFESFLNLTFAVVLYGAIVNGASTEIFNERITMKDLQGQQALRGLPSNHNVTLQYVGLGMGIQNYSCEDTAATPQSIGAIASVFDITDYLLQGGNATEIGVGYLKAYSRLSCQASQNLDNNKCQLKANYKFFDHLGHHWFSDIHGQGVPSFSIPGRGFLSAQKVGDVPAPKNAFPGLRPGTGAVDWLFLPSDGSSRTIALSEVYRINTAGGKPDPSACTGGMRVVTVKYTAIYWYYE